MREVLSIFQKGFQVGLRPKKNMPNDQEHLISSYNMVPNEYGLIGRQEVVNPIVDIQAQEWPWPMLFVLQRYILLFTADSLYLINKDWEPELLYKEKWESTPHIADFMDTVIWSTDKGQWIFAGGKVSTNLKGAEFKTCCNYRGQLIVANGKLPNGPSVEIDGSKLDVSNAPVEGPNIVGWSKIGALDWEYALGNEVGFAPMPWIGETLQLKTLGNKIVVYGSNGIAQMEAISSPVATFGISHWGSIGILNNSAVDGSESAQVFIGSDYNLYSVVPERALSAEGKGPALLGYREFIEKLENPIVTYDPVKGHWWIGDDKRCFILTSKGLGEASITPTQLGRYQGQLLGISFRHGKDDAYVETGTTSFNSRGLKTIMMVEIDVLSKYPVYGRVLWRTDYRKELEPRPFIEVYKHGFFSPRVSGSEFRIGIATEDFREFFLTKMFLRLKNTDKHPSRGIINAGAPEQ